MQIKTIFKGTLFLNTDDCVTLNIKENSAVKQLR